jgi:protein-S-isoprenylcysteine O-methyltransferase Ste14
LKFAKFSLDAKAAADSVGQASIILFFSLGAKQKILTIVGLLTSSAMEPLQQCLHVAAEVSALMFILLVIATTLFRHRPLRAADGFEPWLSALTGTFLAGTLALLPPAEIPLTLVLLGVGMSALGGILSACVLLWLGRSFSIGAQARKLVRSGPYAIVRHPLYIAEEFIVLGMLILVFSPLALVIAVVHWAFQVRRMIHEEKVLSAAYPDYSNYASRTPRIIPHLWPLRRSPA